MTYLSDDTKSSSLIRYAIRIGGVAGDGLQSTGSLLQKYFNRLGYYVVGHPGTQSTIRGGHVWQHVEISSQEIFSFDRPLNFLIALSEETLEVHLRDMKENSYVLINADKVKIEKFHQELIQRKIKVLSFPLSKLSREIDVKRAVLANTIAIGALITLLGIPMEGYIDTLRKRFGGREKLLDMNLKALDLGKTYLRENYLDAFVSVTPATLEGMKAIVISGNEMIALGATASGLKFLAQYPITPASSILTYLSNKASRYGIVVRQAEDELAAITMCIGAAYTGVRVMTASSGPGISLMSEAFGYAGMTETPIVIVDSMRAGPSTGIPTKMEQADLYSIMFMSHGEAPRAILAPRSIKEAFDVTVKAFNIADKYQLPVVILSDFALSEQTASIDEFELDVEINRGKIWTKATDEHPKYKRYELTEDGISPRAFPGTKDAEYILVGAEHDEDSHSLSGNRAGLPESWDLREKMFKKRFRKMELLRDEMDGPELYGVKNADYTVLCWGSTQGAVREAIDGLNQENSTSWNMLSFVDLFPFPFEKFLPFIKNIKTSIMFEVNYTGQLENLIHHHTDWKPTHSIRPLHGETPTPSSITLEITELLNQEENQ